MKKKDQMNVLNTNAIIKHKIKMEKQCEGCTQSEVCEFRSTAVACLTTWRKR